MDEGTRTSGPELDDEQDARSPEEIRADIEETREELGDTVEALAEKADVKGQARAKADEMKGEARSKVESVKESFSSSGREGADGGSADQSAPGVEQLKAKAGENPVQSAAIAAFVAGLLVGVILGRR